MGHSVRVVSMVSVDRFEAQDSEYREAVLPAAITARVVVEAGRTGCWYRYAGSRGRVMGIDSFGESAPGEVLFSHFGLRVQPLVDTMLQVLQEIQGESR
ncbi:MAG: hypothetical protein GXP57_08265 [Deltaproteobacteria bacterium]|nr:hypothetical protein [Deltaproteobacteria bacterium]